MASKSSPIAEAWVQLSPTLAGSERAIQKQLGGVGVGAGKQAGAGFSSGLKSAIGPAAAIAGGALAFDFARDSISAASDLGESINALDVVYGDLSDTIAKQGEVAGKNLGLAATDYNALAVQFSNFVTTVAGEGGDVAGTLDDLSTRAADFASVMNLDVAESAGLFQSGLAGETEPLRKFGIDLSAAAVDSYAYANGIANVGEQLTEAEKVQARYGSLMEQTDKTAGDFANTSDSLANSTRILSAEWENTKARAGEALIPIASSVVTFATDFLDDLGDPETTVGSIAESLGNIWEDISPSIEGAVEAGAEYSANFLAGVSGGIDAYNEGGQEGFLDYATEVGGDLSEWAASGDSAMQQFVGAIDATAESWANDSVGEDWISGAAALGSDISDWAASGEGAGASFISGFEGILGSFASGTAWEDWKSGAEGILDDFWPGGTARTREANDAEQVDFSDAHLANVDPVMRDNIGAITAGDVNDPSRAPATAPTVNFYGDINATDTNDIISQAEKRSRSNQWGGATRVLGGRTLK